MRCRQRTSESCTPVLQPLEPRLLLAGDVLISEFMADNGETFTDGYGRQPDWIELQNTTGSPIDLTDWKLVDSGNEWIFPAVTLPARSYLVVCATDETGQDPAGYWHIGFKLTSDGEYLALLDDSGTVVHQYTPAFPGQLEDISYGVLYEEYGTDVLVNQGATAAYLVPTAGSFDPVWFQPTFNDGGWNAGTTGLGFGLTPSGGTVTLIDRGSIWSYLDDGSDQGAAWRAPSFDDSAWASGPAQLGYGDGDEATVVSYGPDSGSKHVTTYFRRAFNVTNAWSFTDLTVRVLRDDGAVMYLNGHELPRSNMPDGPIDYLTTTSNTSSETTFFEHSVDPTGMLVEGENVLAVEIHQSSRTSSDISFDLELVGETSTVGLLETDVEAEMLGANASILLRVPFTVNDPLEFTQLLLEVAYEDGYVAYLNGTPVAGSNAPEMPLWNSAALTDRPLLDAVQFESVDLTACIDLLVAGENVLAIHAMNDAASDATFLICPRLTALCDVMVTEGYYTTPTPGGPNVPGVVGLVADTKFSVDRGFYDAPFDVEITTDTDGAEIRYTLDGTAPTATGGTQYTGPITIATTTTLRAAAFKPGWLSSDVDTQTYIFLDDVLQQNGAGLPQYWGTYVYGTDAGQLRPANYDMSYDVVGDPRYAGTIRDDLRSIPSLSIVTDPGHLWNPSTGIYCNPLSEGVAWERPCSVELIGTDGSTEFQVNCGIRIHGGWGRRPSQNSKHSFRLLFKDEYGPTKLDYPLFADDDPDADDSFDTIVLRAGFNDQWRGGGTNVTYIQDPWAAKVQNLNGGYGPHGTWVHLYVNGLYWGLYNPVERPNADFAASYFGGSKEEYDAYRTGGLIDGDSAAWNQLLGLVRATPINYDAVQEILDVPNFIDYMVINQFGGNWDWPHNNWYASRHRVDGGKWYFHSWDAEGCLRDVNGNRVNNFGNNGPGEIYERLRQLPEFRLHYADRIHRLMFNDGLLTPSANIATLDSIVAEIDRAIVGESARWGDGRNNQVSPDRTRDGHWLPRINWLRGTYFPQRTSIVLSQFRSASLYPDTVAPTFNIDGSYQHGGAILAGDSLGISAPNGTIYYTLDGTDPRLLGGGVSGDALVYSGAVTLSQSAHVKARAYYNGRWSALNEAHFLVDTSSALRITEIMYNPHGPSAEEWAAGYDDNDEFEFIEIRNISSAAVNLLDVRFISGIKFTFSHQSLGPDEHVVVVRNLAAFDERYDIQANGINVAGEYSGLLDNAGEQIVLCSGTGAVIHDFTYEDGWYGHTDGEGYSLAILNPRGDLALWNTKDGWFGSSELHGTPGRADSGVPAGAIVISEVLAHSNAYPNDRIELHNTTDEAIDIGGWFLSDSEDNLAKYEIAAGTQIEGHSWIVFTENDNFGLDEFDQPTGDPGVRVPFAFSELGDDVYLCSGIDGRVGGYREHVDFGVSPEGMSFGLYSKSTGRTDFTLLTAPTFGAVNDPPFVGELVINEVMYHPADPTAGEIAAGFTHDEDFEYIELYNVSGGVVDLREYYITDGVGFTFGWYETDVLATAVWTMEKGATATWTVDLPEEDAYTVFVYVGNDDLNGGMLELDSRARYEVDHDEGSSTVVLDQNLLAGNWASLGTFPFDAGEATVTLTRGADQADEWTVADRIKFVRTGQEIVADNSDLSFQIGGTGYTTLQAGGYVVLASSYAAFDERYDMVGNNIPVAGQYTGHLDNGGEKVTLVRSTTPEPTGQIPHYRVDHVSYNDGDPWPIEADGSNSSLSRQVPGDYGNEVANWGASIPWGTPGTLNIHIDTSPPSAPSGLHGTIVSHTRIDLTWNPSVDNQTYVDHYVVYRNDQPVATTTEPQYSDTDVTATILYRYKITAINRDGYESDPSGTLSIAVPGIEYILAPDETTVMVVFSEPVTSASAQVIGNYWLTGSTISSAVLDLDGVTVMLTTSTLQINTGYTLTVNNIGTVSGNLIPAGSSRFFIFHPEGSGTVLREYWTGIAGSEVGDLTGQPNYPGSPSGDDYPTAFEAPINWADSYGTRMRGYVHPPLTGQYVFWIAADNTGQLYLSTDENPANKVLIASVSDKTDPREWDKYASQQSQSVYLENGQRYYIEVLHKEGGNNDNLAVAWQLPDFRFEGPIPGDRLSPWVLGDVDTIPPTRPSNVQAVSVSSTRIDLTWDASEDPETGVAHYVIYRGGSNVGTSSTTFFSDTGLNEAALYTYEVTAVNPDAFEGKGSAAIQASPRPSLQWVHTTDETHVVVTFGKPVEQSSAETVGHYAIQYGSSGTVGIDSAGRQADTTRVTLVLSEELSSGVTYTLSVEDVQDEYGNAVEVGSEHSFELQGIDPDLLAWWPFDSVSEGITADLAGGQHDMTVNGATFVSEGRIDGALSFDGNDTAVDDDGASYINGLVSFTVAMWIKADSANTENGIFTVGAPGSSNCLSLRHATYGVGGYQPKPFKAFLSTTGGNTDIEGEANSQTAEWQHVALTWDANEPAGSLMVLYLDGVAQLLSYDYGAVAGSVDQATQMLIGMGQRGTSFGWRGLVDDVRIYGRQLEDYEVAALATIPDPPTAPTADITDVTPDPRSTFVEAIEIVFSEPVTGFEVEDLRLTRDGGANLLTDSEPLSTADNITWTLGGLTALTASSGSYALTLTAEGSGIQDGESNLMEQDAWETWLTDADAPTADIANVTPDPRNALVDAIEIVFSEAIVGFGIADLRLTRDGGSNLLAGAGSLGTTDNMTWTLSGLGGVTAASGEYVLTLTAAGSGIVDAVGNALAGDASDAWRMDTEAPVGEITEIGPDPRDYPVDGVEIIFSEAVVGFGLSDVTLTRDGGGDLLTGAEWVDTADGITWTVSDLTPLTGLSGTYTVTVRAAGSDIHDAAGNLMQLDASDTWVVDTQPPTVDIIDVAPDPRNSAVDAVEIVFSEPVTGFDRADLSLTRDGGANLLSGDETLETGDGATWTLSGLTHLTGAGGTYTLTLRAVGSGIRDRVGKPLVGDASDSWLTELEAPSAGAWHTAAEHANGVGEVLLEIADDGLFSEPRTSGVYRLVIEFSEPIDPASFTPTSVLMAGNDVNSQPVDLSSIVVSTSMRDGDTMGVIDFAGALPDVVRYLVQIEGVTDIAGNPVAGDNNRVFTALAGDANGDFRVNAIDLSYIWPRRTMQIDGVSVGQARSDVNCDGRINAIDLSSVWPRRGADMRDVCDPVLTGKLGGAGTSSDALATAAALAGTPGDGGGSVPAGAADAADISPVVPAMMDVPIAPSAAPDVVTVPAGTQALEVSGEPDAPDTGSDILDVLSLSKLLALRPTASR